MIRTKIRSNAASRIHDTKLCKAICDSSTDLNDFGMGRFNVKGDYAKAYIRFGKRLDHNHDRVDTIEIASIDVKTKYMSRGLFKQLINDIMSKFPQRKLYIESIVNDRLLCHVSLDARFLQTITDARSFISKGYCDEHTTA